MAENMEEHIELESVTVKPKEEPEVITSDNKDTGTTSVSIQPNEKTEHDQMNKMTDDISSQPCPLRSAEHPNEGIVFLLFF